ncbi:hypothetical protein [Ferrimonas kyonanensis]|uniref:hypothetical protein n=1 Tax=Ferrimonas kyonanensis TaxID=364763 RepID=UPI0003F5C9CC|nr:hypothetical protein [Ferrimonas kyonanensis]
MKVWLLRTLLSLFVLCAAVAIWVGPNSAHPEDQRLAMLSQRLQDSEFDLAYDEVKRLLPRVEEPDVRRYLYAVKADIEVGRRHYHYAIHSLTQAQQLGEPNRKVDEAILRLRNHIESMQQERQLDKQYRDARDNGIAASLTGKITILYLYLDDNRWSRWSGKQRLLNRHYLQQVVEWYQARAAQYGVAKPQISSRFFFLKAPRGISKEWLRSKQFFLDAQGLIANQLGYPSMSAFVEAKAPSGQVAMVFHSNGDARSFALSCGNKQVSPNCHYEYVMLTESVSSASAATYTPQVQAHEILHLFGAADLYRIESARDYAVTDLMNYYSDALRHASLDPITAWSIGWSEAPDAPFIIENKGK